jgi:hypothetical protein
MVLETGGLKMPNLVGLFKSEYEYDGFYERGDLLRPKFGLWDACDPVAGAILDLVEAQNEIADCYSDCAEDRGSMASTDAALDAAFKKRYTACEYLMWLLDDRGDDGDDEVVDPPPPPHPVTSA